MTEELQVKLDNGWTLATSSEDGSDYVRLLDENLTEINRWEWEEWRDNPREIMLSMLSFASFGPALARWASQELVH